jgi:beta-glucosidase
MVKFVPYKRNSLINKFFAMIADQLFQTQCLKNYTLNKKTLLFPKHKEFKLKCYVDFHAINYYRLLPIKSLKFATYPNHHKNDLEWEIYPQGIVDCIEKANNIIPLPVYITENGTCDTNDKFRCRYIYDHVKVLLSCKYDIKKYYHWCFIDNFEWCEGESARFGLVHNDFKTQERTIKKSGRFYSDLIKFGLNKNLYDKYVSSETYHN